MLSLLIYCYAIGIFSSRRIERATWRDLGVRFVAANRHPDLDTIAKFRRENFTAVAACFLQVLLLAKELKLLKLGTVSVDGTKLKASASKHRSVTYQRAGELGAQLELEIEALLQQAEEADGKEVADREAYSSHVIYAAWRSRSSTVHSSGPDFRIPPRTRLRPLSIHVSWRRRP